MGKRGYFSNDSSILRLAFSKFVWFPPRRAARVVFDRHPLKPNESDQLSLSLGGSAARQIGSESAHKGGCGGGGGELLPRRPQSASTRCFSALPLFLLEPQPQGCASLSCTSQGSPLLFCLSLSLSSSLALYLLLSLSVSFPAERLDKEIKRRGLIGVRERH